MNLSKQRSTWWSVVCYHREQLDQIIGSTDVKSYAWILHDKDITEDGKPKKHHYHCLIQFYANNRGSWFDRFTSDDMGRVMIEPCISPEAVFLYLTHTDNKSLKSKKPPYRYDDSEVTSTIESLVSDDLKVNKYTTLHAQLDAIIKGEIFWSDFFKAYPEYISSCNNLQKYVEMISAERISIKYQQAMNDRDYEQRKKDGKLTDLEKAGCREVIQTELPF